MKFEQVYLVDEEYLAEGNRVLLPLSAFDRLADRMMDYDGLPLSFQIKSYITQH